MKPNENIFTNSSLGASCFGRILALDLMGESVVFLKKRKEVGSEY